jgi:hypothetical protein
MILFGWVETHQAGSLLKMFMRPLKTKNKIMVIGGWRKSLWSWDCPLKLKLFTWLVAENKILTWENMQRRGFEGPGYCFSVRRIWNCFPSIC